MTRRQIVLDTFDDNFKKYKNQKILIYGRGMYTKLIIERFSDYYFAGIIDRLDLEGCYCGLPILKYEDVIKSGANLIIIAASLENTELIRKRLGNFCIRNGLLLFAVDGRVLNLDDCMVNVDDHASHRLSQKSVRIMIMRHEIICFELASLLLENRNRGGYLIREELLKDVEWSINRGKTVLLCIDSRNSPKYQFFCSKYEDLSRGINICETHELGMYNSLKKLQEYGERSVLYLGGAKGCIAERMGYRTIRIYSPIEMLQNSSYRCLFDRIITKTETIYLHEIANNIFNSPYALDDTAGRVCIKKAYDIGYVFLGPMILDFMFWFMGKLNELHINKVIFASRDGYIVKKIYEYIVSELNLSNMPEPIYIYTSRLVCNMARINQISDIERQSKEYFRGDVQGMLKNRFMLEEGVLLKSDRRGAKSDVEYIKSFSTAIMDKASNLRKAYITYIDTLQLRADDKIAFFDLFASGTCQLTLSRLSNKKFKGLYFSKFRSEDPEKNELDIESYLKADSFMEDHSMFIESIVTSPEPTLIDVKKGGQLILATETRRVKELDYIREAQQGIFDFVETVMKQIGEVPEMANEFVRDVFDKVVSKYTNIDNDIFKNMVIKDELLNRNQYLGDFYKY